MKSRYLMELTTPEVEEFLKGGRIAILPVGCTEMHGPHQPIGTDTIIAKAFALKIAEEVEGLVLPELGYTWAGSTDGFAGTISIGVDLVQALVEAVVFKTYKMGFKHVVMISVHAPNKSVLFITARKIYEKYGKPVLFIDPYKPFDDYSKKLFDGEFEKSKEASLVLAGMNILGNPDLYTEEGMSYDDEAPPYPDKLWKLNSLGGLGYFMQDIRQHACPSRFVSLDRGLEYYRNQTSLIKNAISDLEEYSTDIAQEWNKGWYKQE